MNKSVIIIIVIILFVIIIGLLYMCPRNEPFESRDIEFEDLLLTAYPKKFKCSDCFDKLPLHVRLSKSGGIMYTSYYPPTEANCRRVNCPVYLHNDLTPKPVAEYSPYGDYNRPSPSDVVNQNNNKVYLTRNALSYPEWKRNVYCWMC